MDVQTQAELSSKWSIMVCRRQSSQVLWGNGRVQIKSCFRYGKPCLRPTLHFSVTTSRSSSQFLWLEVILSSAEQQLLAFKILLNNNLRKPPIIFLSTQNPVGFWRCSNQERLRDTLNHTYLFSLGHTLNLCHTNFSL